MDDFAKTVLLNAFNGGGNVVEIRRKTDNTQRKVWLDVNDLIMSENSEQIDQCLGHLSLVGHIMQVYGNDVWHLTPAGIGFAAQLASEPYRIVTVFDNNRSPRSVGRIDFNRLGNPTFFPVDTVEGDAQERLERIAPLIWEQIQRYPDHVRDDVDGFEWHGEW
jgi:hypothetical protein